MQARHGLIPAYIILLLLASAPEGHAQTASSNSAAALAMRDGEIRLVNALLGAFSQVMDPREQAMLRQIEVRVPMDYDLTRVDAYHRQARVIEVSFGFFGVLLDACDNWILAELYAAQDPAIYDKYEDYLRYLNQVIDHNERAVGQPPVKPRPFADWAGIPAPVTAALMARSDAQQYQGELRMAAVAFVLAHELGHHMLGHVDLPPPRNAAESQAREAEADGYAAQLTMRVGVPAFGALPALAFFAAAEDGSARDTDASHPPAGCRILRAMLDSVDRMAADQHYAPLFQKAPGMLPGGAQYNALTAQRQQYCR